MKFRVVRDIFKHLLICVFHVEIFTSREQSVLCPWGIAYLTLESLNGTVLEFLTNPGDVFIVFIASKSSLSLIIVYL